MICPYERLTTPKNSGHTYVGADHMPSTVKERYALRRYDPMSASCQKARNYPEKCRHPTVQ